MIFSSTVVSLKGGQPKPTASPGYLPFLPPPLDGRLGVWVRTDAATDLTGAGVLGLRKRLLAIVATLGDVVSLLPVLAITINLQKIRVEVHGGPVIISLNFVSQ
jgi:hypothetical protein